MNDFDSILAKINISDTFAPIATALRALARVVENSHSDYYCCVASPEEICCTCQSSYSLDALLFCIQVPTSTVPLCRGYQQMCEQKQTNNEQIPSNSDFSIMRNS
ncbi:hypothetical protein RB195_022420 [Necator americanus]|uniref:Uncharacterized protein n=1 Tax=Necator americanus TaxID=51031 RepID=A0ABR1EF95_NECAM